MRYLIVLSFAILPALSCAFDWEDRKIFNEAPDNTKIRIISSTDTDVFEPFINAFVQQNATVEVEYLVTGTAEVDRQMRANS